MLVNKLFLTPEFYPLPLASDTGKWPFSDNLIQQTFTEGSLALSELGYNVFISKC